MTQIVLKQATALLENGFRPVDLLIDGPYIAQIAPEIAVPAGATVIDCSGKLVIPGLIDAHVHFRQPGMEQKATIASESRAAALGGVTSFMDMPNTFPATTTIAALHDKMALAARDSVINYGFHLGASHDNLEEIKRVDPHEIASIKVYMGSTTGNLLVDDNHELHQVFKHAPTLVMTHCEDNAIVNANTQRAKEQYGSAIPFDLHPIIRNRDCCLKSTQLAVELALATGARLHVAHVSTRDEVDYLKQFATGPLATRQISCEVCIPHLFFNESDYSRLQGFLKCNPAVKYEFDRLSLIRALRAGIITTIGTDHAPHELAVKNSLDYLKVASGLPSVQFSLNVIFELARRHELSLEEGLKAATCNVAARFGVEKRGTLKEGFFADIAVLDTSSRYTVTPEDVASLCGWSPMVGQSFSSRVTHTIASGHLVVADGKLVGEPGQAQALRFNNAR